MNDMHESVTLPDPVVKPLLHPIDLPEARGLYLRGWWFARLCSLPITVAIGAIVWTLSGSLLAALLAPITTFAIAFAASRWHEARAWDFIPRRRQDPDSGAPWRLLAAAFDAVALLVTAIAVILAVTHAPAAEGVLAFAVGSGIGVAVVQIVELILAVVHKQDSTSLARRVILLLAVIAASVLVAVFGSGGTWAQDAHAIAAAGLVTMLLAQLLWLLFARPSREASQHEER